MADEKNDLKVVYTGIFLPREEVEKIPYLRETRFGGAALRNEIQNMHITLAFRPKKVDLSMVEYPVLFEVKGYANDGNNEGILVGNFSGAQNVVKVLNRLKKPHITLSVSSTGKPVDTAKLNFHQVWAPQPIVLRGRFGMYFSDGKVRYYLPKGAGFFETKKKGDK